MTQNSIHDPRCFRESRNEFQGSRFEIRELRIEDQVLRPLKFFFEDLNQGFLHLRVSKIFKTCTELVLRHITVVVTVSCSMYMVYLDLHAASSMYLKITNTFYCAH